MHRKVKYSAKFFFGFHKVNLHHTTLGHTDQIYSPHVGGMYNVCYAQHKALFRRHINVNHTKGFFNPYLYVLSCKIINYC